ncbi:unnamed protein product, partial [Meganyctiphanes norvegica]
MQQFRIIIHRGKSWLINRNFDHYDHKIVMSHLVRFCRNAKNAESFMFLRKEVPVRLANIMKEFSLLPENMLHMPSILDVRKMYQQSFQEILDFESRKLNEPTLLQDFTDALVKIRNRHTDVVMTMAQGVLEMKEQHRIDANIEANIQYFLDRFYMNRISIRMLINQHTLLFGESIIEHDHIGCIDPHCDVVRVVEDAYANARFLCDQYYLASPELSLKKHNVQEKKTLRLNDPNNEVDRKPLSVVYVPSHLYHMLFELFKNAMRAVVEHHGYDSDQFPPIEVLLVMGEEDLTIKLSDQGGGIARSNMDLLFNYMYSTAPQPAASGLETPPLAGYGYGLPLSRLYARYLHGDLMITSSEGFGSDAIIFLKAISSEANELLPVYNKTCMRQYATPVQTHDWSSQNHSAMFVRPFSTSSLNKMLQAAKESQWHNMTKEESTNSSTDISSNASSDISSEAERIASR